MENFSEFLGQMREYCMDPFHLVNLNLRSIRLLIMLIFLELTLHSSLTKKTYPWCQSSIWRSKYKISAFLAKFFIYSKKIFQRATFLKCMFPFSTVCSLRIIDVGALRIIEPITSAFDWNLALIARLWHDMPCQI